MSVPSEPKIHVTDVTTSDGIRSICGAKGVPTESEYNQGIEIKVCKPHRGTILKFTDFDALTTCKSCLRILARDAMRGP